MDESTPFASAVPSPDDAHNVEERPTLDDVMWNASAMKRLVVSGLTAGVMTMILALIVSSSLMEISTSRAFSVIFGILFLGLAGVIGVSAWKSPTVNTNLQRGLLSIASILVLIACFMCFILDEKWFTRPSSASKVFLYIFPALALVFAFVFVLTEMLHMRVYECCCQRFGDPLSCINELPLLANKQQLLTLYCGGLALGVIFGLLFGSLDAEDEDAGRHHLRTNVIVSIPLGFVFGGVVGILFEWFRATYGADDDLHGADDDSHGGDVVGVNADYFQQQYQHGDGHDDVVPNAVDEYDDL